jgi:isocitrate/isopropylmalate dehydrogenase
MQNQTRKEIAATLIPGGGIGPDIAGKGLVSPVAILLAASRRADRRSMKWPGATFSL